MKRKEINFEEIVFPVEKKRKVVEEIDEVNKN
jgi:hypothetical protein